MKCTVLFLIAVLACKPMAAAKSSSDSIENGVVSGSATNYLRARRTSWITWEPSKWSWSSSHSWSSSWSWNTPTIAPTETSTTSPTNPPTNSPTDAPSDAPTETFTSAPTGAPITAPTEAPSSAGTSTKSIDISPTQSPTVDHCCLCSDCALPTNPTHGVVVMHESYSFGPGTCSDLNVDIRTLASDHQMCKPTRNSYRYICCHAPPSDGAANGGFGTWNW